MTIRREFIAFCLVLTTMLIATSAAHAAPAGDEYLPRVPKAAGKQVVAGEGKGAGSTILQPALRGAGGGNGSNGDPSDGPPVGSQSADNSSAVLGTLGDPLVLLIIAGVISTAIAMTLRGRRAAIAGPPPDSDREQRTPSGSPRTPDGEIVDGDDGDGDDGDDDDDDEKKP